MPAILVGLLASFAAAGGAGALYGLLGMVIALLAFGWMWGLGMMGAGDVKLLMGFAALAGAATRNGKSGITFSVDLMLMSLFVGGALALGILLVQGRLAGFFRKIYRFAFTFLQKQLETEFPKADPKSKMPFGVSISIAAVWVWFDNPLARWGFHSWN